MSGQKARYTLSGVIEETTFGTVPSAAVQRVNLTSFPAIRGTKGEQAPNVLTNDRRSYATRPLQKAGSVSFSSLLQFQNFLPFHEGALANDQSSAVSVTGTGIAASSGVITDSGNGFGSIQKGDLLSIYGAGVSPNSTTQNAKLYGPVTAAAAGSITVPAAQISDFSAGGSVTIKVKRLVDSTTFKSYVAEWQATQLTNNFRYQTGNRVSSISWAWQQGQYVTETVELMGKYPDNATATQGTGSATAAPTSDFMNCVDDFQTLYVNGAATTWIASQLNATFNSNLGSIYGLGSIGPGAINTGGISGTITGTVLYDDNSLTLANYCDDHTTMALWWWAKDTAGNAMAWSVPACKPSGDIAGGDADSDLEIQNLSLSIHDASKDSSSSYYSTGIPYQVGLFYFPIA